MQKIIIALLVFISLQVNAQYTMQNAHSHNDYANIVPFWTAYNARFGSIEADIFAVDGKLIVAHTKKETKKGQTIDDLYLQPLILRFAQNRNRLWPDSEDKLQLLIDLKTPPHPTLDLLVAKLAQHPQVFDRTVNPYAVQVVISGDMPKPADFVKYPPFIMFDGRLSTTYSAEQLKRIALYSSTWSAPKNKMITATNRDQIGAVVRTVHGQGKKMRFWATADTPEAWQLMIDLNIDYINTDKINELAAFLNDHP